jgi:RNA polymerase sigma factor (sigma-70 family)
MTQTVRFVWRRKTASVISSPDLIRECGRKLTNQALWAEFQDRFRERIFTYLLRILHHRRIDRDDMVSVADDLAQDVCMRLVQNDGRILRDFKGETELTVAAFLARVCATVVGDHCRRESAQIRGGGDVVPISILKNDADRWQPASDFDTDAILRCMDVRRLVESDPEQRHAARNALVFQLYYIDGFTFAEIAAYPGFNLTERGVETVLQRMRARIREIDR